MPILRGKTLPVIAHTDQTIVIHWRDELGNETIQRVMYLEHTREIAAMPAEPEISRVPLNASEPKVASAPQTKSEP